MLLGSLSGTDEDDSGRHWIVVSVLLLLSLLGLCVALTLTDAIETTVTWYYGDDYRSRVILYWALFGGLLLILMFLTMLYLRMTRSHRSRPGRSPTKHEEVEQKLSSVLPGTMLINLPSNSSTTSTAAVAGRQSNSSTTATPAAAQAPRPRVRYPPTRASDSDESEGASETFRFSPKTRSS